MPTISEIEKFAARKRPDVVSYRNCGPINRSIASELRSEFESISVEVIEGGFWYSQSERAEHAYIEIKVEDKTIIVDGSIRQFCHKYRDQHWFSLGGRDELPAVAVLDGKTDSDRYEVESSGEWYDMYLDQIP